MVKFIIGTANFGQSYGLSKFKVKKKELKKILNNSKKKNIKFLDTAIDYNITNNYIKSINLSDFNIITKIKLPTFQKKKFIDSVPNLIIKEMRKFRVKKISGLLIHNLEDLRSKIYGKAFLKKILELKKEKIVSKVGVSIYEPRDLSLIFSTFVPDIIQIPISIFDQRFLKKNFLKKLSKRNIAIHARSIFLQGLLLKNPKQIKKLKINNLLKEKIIYFNSWCESKKITPLEASINFIKKNKQIDKIILGIDSNIQLNDVIKAYYKKINIENFDIFSVENKFLIDPRRW